MPIRIVLVIAILVVQLTAATAAQSTISLYSPAFKNNEPIPLAYSGYGDFKSPPLAWSGIPRGTRELALILEDPDVPLERFSVHWLAYNIPATAKGLPEGQPKSATLAGPGIEGLTFGLNALKRLGYLPPRPFAGSGVHHYTFTLYALDADLALAEGLTKDELLAALKGHILGEGRLIGLFERREP